LRRRIGIAILLFVAGWWALWDSSLFPGLSRRFHSLLDFPQAILFWLIPTAAVALVYGLCYLSDTILLHRKWTTWDLLRLVFWRTMSPTVALLFVAAAFEKFYERRIVGIFWVVSAAALAIISVARLRVAQGMKLQRVKSGELYKRAFAMAKKTNVALSRVYVVPVGKGHLTNAYGMWQAVAITDNYGKFLDEGELDFVVAHELTHVKQHHGRKNLLTMAVVYGVAAIVAFVLRPVGSRPAFDVAVALLPALLFYFQSRTFEYEADRTAVEWTASPEAGIQALVNLYRETETPDDCDRITELFMTHPALTRRVSAIQAAANEAPTASNVHR